MKNETYWLDLRRRLRSGALLGLALAWALVLTACSAGEDEGSPPAAGGEASSPAKGHAGSSAEAGASGHSHEGEPHALGTADAGGVEVFVTRIGDLTPGGETLFELEIEDDPGIVAVRIWVGDESGRGSLKSLAGRDGPGRYHAHVELDDTLPEGSRVWIEVETEEGTETGSVEPDA